MPPGPYINVYGFRQVSMTAPNVKGLPLQAVARSLSHICRFAGNLGEFYSVAQHSVLVSWLAPEGWGLEALLHDAAEMFTGDITRPVKSMFPAIDVQELKLLDALLAEFGARPRSEWPAGQIGKADDLALACEMRDLWGRPQYPPTYEGDLPRVSVIPVGHREAYDLFMKRAEELQAERRRDRLLAEVSHENGASSG